VALNGGSWVGFAWSAGLVISADTFAFMIRRKASPLMARPAARALTGLAIGAIAIATLGLPASAEEEIVVDSDEILRGTPGSVMPVSSQPIPAELQGKTCDLRVVAENGSSVHPGNTAIITTGDARVEVAEVENSPDGSVIDVEPVLLGEMLNVELQLGPDGVSSLGFTVAVNCATAPPVVPAQVEAPTPAETTPPTVLPTQQTAPPVQTAPPALATPGNPTFTG